MQKPEFDRGQSMLDSWWEENNSEKNVPQSSQYGLTPVSIFPPLLRTNVHSSVPNNLILTIERVIKQNPSAPLPLSATWFGHIHTQTHKDFRFLYEMFEIITTGSCAYQNSTLCL